MLKKKYYSKKIEIGCDEAGRGCLAGPVVAAAVILPKDFYFNEINDSKILSEKKRIKLEKVILNNVISYGIGICTVNEIDKFNILNASITAMHRAINHIAEEFDTILVDGNKFHKYKNKEHICIVKGDSKYLNIAAASILAKNYRDRIMQNLSKEFPQYLWGQNKGYPTKRHRQAILSHGANIHHRKSFKLINNQKTLF